MTIQRSTKLLICLLAATTLSSAAARAAEPLKVVILSGLNVHDWKATTPLLEQIYNDSKRFKVVETVNDAASITAGTFGKCDVFVSNWTCHPVMTGGPWTPEGKQAFADAIRKGKGFVQFHAACAACNDWEDFQELSGVTWKWNFTSHTAYHTFKVVIRDSAHPITKGMSDFWITDELYQQMVKMGKSDYHLLADAFAETLYSGTGKNEPMLMTTQLGKGRGVNFLLGHDVHTMQNIAWQTIMLRATEWAAGGKTTIPIPTDDWPITASAAEIVGIDADAAIKAATQYAFGQGNQPLSPVQKLVMVAESCTGKTAAARSSKLAVQLGAAIAECKTPEAKAFFCDQLARIGTPDQVLQIAPLLADEQAATTARRALERIRGPAAAQALRAALGSLQGALRVGVINSIGVRRDADAIEPLTTLLHDTDLETAGAAVAALGNIGTSQAADALRTGREGATGPLKAAFTDACFVCAEHLIASGDKQRAGGMYRLLYAPDELPAVRAAALRGKLIAEPREQTPTLKEALASNEPELNRMAVFVVGNLPKVGDTRSLAELIGRLPADVQPAFVSALGRRGDKAAANSIRRAATGEDTPVRIAAIVALARLGDESDIALLTARATSPDAAEKAAVSATLASIPGELAEQAIVQMLVSGDGPTRKACAEALVARNAEQTIARVLDDAIREKHVDAQTALIAVLPQLGTDSALAADRRALSSDAAGVHDAAIAALAEWPTPAVFADLVQAARDARHQAIKPALVQALVRLLPQAIRYLPAERRAEEGAARIAEVLQVADRPEDQRALFDLLGTQATPSAFELAMTRLIDPVMAEAAGLAAAKNAATLDNAHREAVKQAMQKVLATCKSPETLQAAQSALHKVARGVNLALSATASSPDNLDSDGAAGGDAAGNDGNPSTCWDEVDGQKLYAFTLTWKQPVHISAIGIRAHAFESHCPKDFDVLCDGKVVKSVQNLVYDRQNVEAFLEIPPTTCTALELRITGYYGGSPAIRELEIYDLDTAPVTQPATGPPAYRWQQTDTTVALMNHERTVWQFNYAKDQPTPWFYPLNLPDGTELVWLNPPDHPWHHALWFSWKDLNGLTYWEQGPGQGRVQVEEVKVTTQADFSAQIELTAGYHPEGKPTILTEKRLMTITAPDANGAYRIDWKGTFTAGTQDVHMKGGTAGGGYAGMSVRISNQSRDWQLLDSEGRQDVPGGGVTAHTHGQHSRWADFSLVSTRTGTTAGIAVFDHPTNLRYPSFWHDIMDSRHTFGYFSPAPLWKEPYDLPAGKALSLRYRVLVHPGRPDPVQVEAEFKSFSETR